MGETWTGYIITNYTNRVLYTGITNDLGRGLHEHKTGLVESSFSRKYRLYRLIWYQELSSPQEAIEIEKQIKGWRRAKMLALINAMNPGFQDLSTPRYALRCAQGR